MILVIIKYTLNVTLGGMCDNTVHTQRDFGDMCNNTLIQWDNPVARKAPGAWTESRHPAPCTQIWLTCSPRDCAEFLYVARSDLNVDNATLHLYHPIFLIVKCIAKMQPDNKA